MLLLVFFVALVWWGIALYLFLTTPSPTHGGHYIEGAIGQPRYVNPLIIRPGVERSLTALVYSGLFRYDTEGMIIPDLVEHYDVSEDGKTYKLSLRQDVQWHDGEAFNVDDVIFTFERVKDQSFSEAGVSGDLRVVFSGFKMERIDDYTMNLTVEEENAYVLSRLTLGILPEHIWNDIGSEQFQLADFNQKPIGTGPYAFADADVDEEGLVSTYVLRAHADYHLGEPYITKLSFAFFEDRDAIVAAMNSGEISGAALDRLEHVDAVTGEQLVYDNVRLPSYAAVFFNQTESVPLAFDEVREALTYATNRTEIIERLFGKTAVAMYGPLGEASTGYDREEQQPGEDLEKARELLDKNGWKEQEDGIRKKGEERLAFTLHVRDKKEITGTAELLKEQWRRIGVEVEIISMSATSLHANVIAPRKYDALFALHPSRLEADLRPLWHSKAMITPGINYAQFKDKSADEALDELQKERDAEERADLYSTIQERILREDPAVFLYSPGFVFVYNNDIKGIDIKYRNSSHERFLNVPQWYIQEKRRLNFSREEAE